MDTAAKILILGGLSNLVVGLITGGLMVRIRITAPEAPRYLTAAHLGALIWTPILLGLVWAVRLSQLTPWVESLAAALLVAGSLSIDGRDLLYWKQDITDEFVERPPAFVLGPISAAATATGTVILSIGALQAL